MKKYLVFSFASILILAVLSTVFILYPYRDRSLDRIREQGRIRIGYALEPPYAFLSDDSTVTGESPVVAAHIAEALGIERIDWVLSDFSSLIAGLRSGQFDAIASGLFITPERSRVVSFSLPSFHVREGLLVAAGNPGRLTSYDMLGRTDSHYIAVLTGSTEESLLAGYEISELSLTRVLDAQDGQLLVSSGVVDALALSAPTVRWMAMHDGQKRTEAALLDVGAEGERISYGAFAFRQEDRQLLAAWNDAMSAFIGTEAHLALVAPFGFTQDDLPGFTGKQTWERSESTGTQKKERSESTDNQEDSP